MSTSYQLSLFDDEKKHERLEKLEYAIDDIRHCYGHYAIDLAFMHLDPKLGKLNPKDDHTIHPISYL
jgi:DNA polymerase-4